MSEKTANANILNRRLVSSLRRRAQIMSDTAQMRSQFPNWLLVELENAAKDLELAADIISKIESEAISPSSNSG